MFLFTYNSSIFKVLLFLLHSHPVVKPLQDKIASIDPVHFRTMQKNILSDDIIIDISMINECDYFLKSSFKIKTCTQAGAK